MRRMFDPPATAPMELRDYLGILRRRAWVIILVTAIVVGAAAAWSFSRPNEYKASGTLVVSTSNTNGSEVANQADILQSQAVHQLADQASPGVGVVTADAGTNNGSIAVNSTSRSPAQAATTVNAHVDAYLTYLHQQAQQHYDVLNQDLQPKIASLQQQIAALDQQIALGASLGLPTPVAVTQRADLNAQLTPLLSQMQDASTGVALAGQDVTVVTRATPPAQRTSPDPKKDLLVALGAGLLLGVVVAFLLEFLDDSIRSRQDLLAAAGNSVPIMGVIPAGRSSRADVVSITAPQSPAAEAYRSLRTAVNFAQLKGSNCIEITSTRSRQGKTETMANLAVLAARAGQRVVVVDCDLRFPRVHDFFGLSNEVGFTSVVHGELLSSALQRVPGVERLYVLPSGPTPPNPSELLATERCHEVLASLQADDTLVIVDTPPVLTVTDAAALAPSAGGILIVASARVTRRKQVRQALEAFRQISAPILGLVLYSAASAETAGYGKSDRRHERKQARRRTVEPAAPSSSSAGFG
jgi:capsular exopolysaccharide synthesis family protein